MCEKCKNNIKILESRVKVAQDNLVDGLYERIFCPLDERASESMYTTKTETTTETYPLNACDHQFIDVYDYKEESIYGKSIVITKKYILSYCKVCGYTINNSCTECHE